MSSRSTEPIPLKCARCGASLEVDPEWDQVTCLYCKTAQTIQRSRGSLGLKIISEEIGKIQIGTDRTAAELEYRRLKDERDELYAKKSKLDHHYDALLREASRQMVYGILAVFAGAIVFAWGGEIVGAGLILIGAFFGWRWFRTTMDTSTQSSDYSSQYRKRNAALEAKIQELKGRLQ